MTGARGGVAEGTIFLGAQAVGQYVVLFLFYAALARLLPPSEIGKNLAPSVCSKHFQCVYAGGPSTAVTKFTASFEARGMHDDANYAVKVSLKIIMLMSLSALFIILPFAPMFSQILFGTPSNSLVLIIACVSGAIANIAAVYAGVALGLRRYGLSATGNFVQLVSSRAAAIVLVALGVGLEGIFIGFAIGATLTNSLQYSFS